MAEFDLDTKIWRYLSFDKFIDLLTTSELHLSKPTRFDDSWELYPPRGLLNPDFWRSKLAQNEQLNRQSDINLDELIENTIARFEAAFFFRRDEYSFSCWSMAERDHAGLWQQYTDWKSAVAVSTTPRVFLSAIRDDRMRAQQVMLGAVTYLDFEADTPPSVNTPAFRVDAQGQIVEVTNSFVLPFLFKRTSYAHEHEVRLAVYNPPDVGASSMQRLPLELNAMVQDVIVAPKANEAFIELVSNLCNARLPGKAHRKSTLEFDKKPTERSVRYRDATALRFRVQKEPTGYIVFDSIADFGNWHQAVCKLLAIPSIGERLSDGAFAFDTMPSARWAEPIRHPKGDDERVIAAATESIRGEYQLLSREDCEALGWFRRPD